MNLLFSFIIFVWALRIFKNVLAYVQLWWIKEYRFDRMLVHLGTTQGKRILWPKWKRPPVKPKTILLATSTLTALYILFVFLPFLPIVNVLLVDLFSFPMTGALVFLFYIPTKLYHTVLIGLATRKLRLHVPMTVIGITGSYGKTSVKDYLATILAEKFTVFKTEASKNSPIGIAEVVLKNLRPDHEIFVVEMGAYKRGEIAGMARMVKPQIGIITAINPQHQDLFGTIENTMKAKYELVAGLVGKKLAILNTDDSRVRTMGEWALRDGRDVWWWSKEVHSSQFTAHGKKTFQAREINVLLNGVEFTCEVDKEKVRVQASVLGEHQVSNILAAVAGAVACGMNFTDAAAGAAKIRPAKSVMQKIAGMNGSTFIDDTFNNNPDAAKAAIAFLAKTKGRKILVFQPMIELGSYGDSAHEEVGMFAGRICDEILLTNKNSFEAFVSGAKRANPRISISVLSGSSVSHIKENLKVEDTVLFKGKEAGLVLQRISMVT